MHSEPRTPIAPPVPASDRNTALAGDAVLVAARSAAQAEGITDLRLVAGQVCGIKRFLFPTALVVKLHPSTWRRYCYEHDVEARAALAGWEEGDQPPGPGIKCKGQVIDLLKPAFCRLEREA